MNDNERAEIKEYINQAVVAGRVSASDMADHILKKIDTGLNLGIEKYVNGNLREIKEHLTRQDTVQGEIKGEIVEVKEEQKRVQIELLKLQRDTGDVTADTRPLVKFKTGVDYFFKGLLWTCGVVIAVGGAWFVIIKLIK